MKNIIVRTVQILTLSIFLSMSVPSFAAPPPPPPGSGGTGGSVDQRTGGATLNSGLFILLALGLAYGSRKLWLSYKAGELDIF